MTTKIPVELSSTPSIVDNGDATAITIDSSERVMIGTTDAGYPDYGDSLTLGDVDGGGGNAGMTIRSGTSSYGTFYFSDATGTAAGTYAGKMQYNHSTNSMVFATNGSDRLTIDSSGKVGLGTTAPESVLHIFDGGSSVNNQITFGNPSVAHKAIIHHTAAGSEFLNIECKGTTSGYGNIVFKTGGTPDERMRIDSIGNLLIGTTSTGFSDQGVIITDGQYVGTMDGSHCMTLNRKSSDGLILRFYKDESLVGSISTNANSLPSDRNFKRDISDLNLGLNLVKKLKPSQYNYKVDDEDSPKMYGLIAQDLEESLTEVGIEKNSTWLLQHEHKDDENQSDYALDYQKLTPILIKAIQEQQTIIEDLQTQINEVKNGN